jgi:hypothetical protein
MPLSSRLHPLVVAPAVSIQRPHDRSRVRPELHGKANRVGLDRIRASDSGLDVELVQRTASDTGNEEFPDSAGATAAHWMPAFVPPIEAADDTDAQRMWRPHGKGCPGHTRMRPDVRAQLGIELVVRALVEEVQIEVGEDRWHRIRVVDFLARSTYGRHDQPVVERHGRRNDGLEKSFLGAASHRDDVAPMPQRDRDGFRNEGAHCGQGTLVAANRMRSKYGEGLAVRARDDSCDVGGSRIGLRQRCQSRTAFGRGG